MSQQQKQFKILLIGDSCYDYYHYGSVTRISPEAPIPIFDLKNSQTKNGMAANVCSNLETLGVTVDLQTFYSERKNRYIDVKTRQQLLRVDEKIHQTQEFLTLQSHKMSEYDAVVVSDYQKGFIQYEHYHQLNSLFSGPIFVDTKKTDLKQFENIYFKINQSEFEALTSVPDCSKLIVTHGEQKVTWNNLEFIPPRVNTYDVCGAGDSFLAALVYKYLVDSNMETAINFAMHAAAVTVQHVGVYAPTLQEIEK